MNIEFRHVRPDVAKIELETLLRQTDHLPPLPQVAIKALRLIDDPRCSIPELSKVLSFDQALAGRILRWANSAFYGLRSQVATLDQAIMYLGLMTVRELVVAASVGDMLNRQVAGYSLERGELWRHSVAVAAGTRWVARKQDYRALDRAFIAGLLHDIGKLVLDKLLRSDSRWQEQWNTLREQGVPFTEMERELTGYDHAEIGGFIAEKWNLPKPLCEAIALHHHPDMAESEPNLVSYVHIADAGALMAGIGLGYEGLSYRLDEAVCAHLHWTVPEMENLMQHEVDAVNEAVSVFHS